MTDLDPNDWPSHDVSCDLTAVPARWCVLAVFDADAKPIQLVISKNPRQWLRRRLEKPADAGPSRSVDLAGVIASVRWRRVDSAFEADVVHLHAARRLFPDRWRRLVPKRAAHFVCVEFAAVPKIVVREEPAGAATFGPFAEKRRAEKWIEQFVDAFDLCRFPVELAKAPAGRACAYQQMGRCDAPCDGSVPMKTYADRVRDAVAVFDDLPAFESRELERMKSLAAALKFEEAGRAKARVEIVKPLDQSGRIGAFAFLSIQPGPSKKVFKLFHVGTGGCEETLGVIDPDLFDGRLVGGGDSGSIDAQLTATIVHHLTHREKARWLDARSTPAKVKQRLREVADELNRKSDEPEDGEPCDQSGL